MQLHYLHGYKNTIAMFGTDTCHCNLKIQTEGWTYNIKKKGYPIPIKVYHGKITSLTLYLNESTNRPYIIGMSEVLSLSLCLPV